MEHYSTLNRMWMILCTSQMLKGQSLRKRVSESKKRRRPSVKTEKATKKIKLGKLFSQWWIKFGMISTRTKVAHLISKKQDFSSMNCTNS